MEVVLEVQASKGIAVILEFSGALAECRIAAVIGQLSRQQVGKAVEAELGGLEEFIVEIDAAALQGAAEVEILLRQHPTDVVTPCEVIPYESGGGVVAKTESAIYSDLLN